MPTPQHSGLSPQHSPTPLLSGKTGLIVGIANDRSYAFHIAKSLLAHGARCAFTHLPGEKNERRTRRAVESLGLTDPWLVPLDASSDTDLDAAFARYADSFDHMHFLVHSIAFADREWLAPGKFTSTPRAAYLSAIDISAYTLLAMAHRARPLMARTTGAGASPASPQDSALRTQDSPPPSASIMAMSYYGGEKVTPGYNVMGVAKAALESTARYLAWELGEQNIRVNIISGGYLRTLASSAVGGTDEMAEHGAKRAPLRRNVEGKDVGDAAAFLASDLSAGVTGETLYVDCGVNVMGV
jgi:enoyl-[acyl-carrier protein] reductase I